MNETSDMKQAYEKPAMDVLDIQTEGSILANSGDLRFDLDPEQQDEWS